MHRLVEDLLHHARARAGALRILRRPVGLDALVRDAAARCARCVPGAPAVVVGDLPEGPLRADADALRQALENLMVNAVTHGGPGVRARVWGERSGSEVLLHVEDDGPGIPAADLPRVFEPFGRGDRARTVPGHGLGLAIALEVARAHGGDLTVASPPASPGTPRPGCRFTLRLPAPVEPVAEPDPPRS
jgi:signal transduction histidine kinase